MGSLEVALKVTIDGKVVYDGALNASVVNDNFIWSFGFDKLLYGADQMHNLPGYIPGGAQIDITEGVDDGRCSRLDHDRRREGCLQGQ